MKRETIINTFIGFGEGDAFGVCHEPLNRKDADKVTFDSYTDNMLVIGNNRFIRGNYSDDTEQTLAVMRALMDGRIFRSKMLVDYFKDEFNRTREREGIHRFGYSSTSLKYFLSEISRSELQDKQKKYASNAAVMRSIPFGFFYEKEDLCTINAYSTHPGIESYFSSLIIAYAVEHILVKGENPEDVIGYCSRMIIPLKKHLEIIDSDNFDLDKDFQKLCGPQPIPKFLEKGMEIYGLPPNAYYTAASMLYILKHSKDAFDALKMSISFGGDVDTLAALTTGIMAGAKGLDSLPKFLSEDMNKPDFERIVEVSDMFYNHIRQTL